MANVSVIVGLNKSNYKKIVQRKSAAERVRDAVWIGADKAGPLMIVGLVFIWCVGKLVQLWI